MLCLERFEVYKISKMTSIFILVAILFCGVSSGAGLKGGSKYERRTKESQYSQPRKQRSMKNHELKKHHKFYHGDYATGLQGFLYYCRLELYDKSTDGILSQNDFADFLYDYCRHLPTKGPDCVEPPDDALFSSLPLDIQLHFVADICSGDRAAKVSCVAHLNQAGIEFGSTKDLHGLCTSTYSLLEPSALLVSEPSPSPVYNETSRLNGMNSTASPTTIDVPTSWTMSPSKSPIVSQSQSSSGAPSVTQSVSLFPTFETPLSPSTSPSPPTTEDLSSSMIRNGFRDEEGLTRTGALGIGAIAMAAFAALIFVCAKRLTRKRKERQLMMTGDDALDGGDSIRSEDSDELDFAATVNSKAAGKASVWKKTQNTATNSGNWLEFVANAVIASSGSFRRKGADGEGANDAGVDNLRSIKIEDVYLQEFVDCSLNEVLPPSYIEEAEYKKKGGAESRNSPSVRWLSGERSATPESIEKGASLSRIAACSSALGLGGSQNECQSSGDRPFSSIYGKSSGAAIGCDGEGRKGIVGERSCQRGSNLPTAAPGNGANSKSEGDDGYLLGISNVSPELRLKFKELNERVSEGSSDLQSDVDKHESSCFEGSDNRSEEIDDQVADMLKKGLSKVAKGSLPYGSITSNTKLRGKKGETHYLHSKSQAKQQRLDAIIAEDTLWRKDARTAILEGTTSTSSTDDDRDNEHPTKESDKKESNGSAHHTVGNLISRYQCPVRTRTLYAAPARISSDTATGCDDDGSKRCHSESILPSVSPGNGASSKSDGDDESILGIGSVSPELRHKFKELNDRFSKSSSDFQSDIDKHESSCCHEDTDNVSKHIDDQAVDVLQKGLSKVDKGSLTSNMESKDKKEAAPFLHSKLHAKQLQTQKTSEAIRAEDALWRKDARTVVLEGTTRNSSTDDEGVNELPAEKRSEKESNDSTAEHTVGDLISRYQSPVRTRTLESVQEKISSDTTIGCDDEGRKSCQSESNLPSVSPGNGAISKSDGDDGYLLGFGNVSPELRQKFKELNERLSEGFSDLQSDLDTPNSSCCDDDSDSEETDDKVVNTLQKELSKVGKGSLRCGSIASNAQSDHKKEVALFLNSKPQTKEQRQVEKGSNAIDTKDSSWRKGAGKVLLEATAPTTSLGGDRVGEHPTRESDEKESNDCTEHTVGDLISRFQSPVRTRTSYSAPARNSIPTAAKNRED